MKDSLKTITVPQDKANHFIWGLLLCFFIFTVTSVINRAILSDCTVADLALISGTVTSVLVVVKWLYCFYGDEDWRCTVIMLSNLCGAMTFVFIVHVLDILK